MDHTPELITTGVTTFDMLEITQENRRTKDAVTASSRRVHAPRARA